jgi:hypothetical protein
MKRIVVLLSILALSLTGVAFGSAKAKKTSGVAYAGVTHTEGKDLYVSGDLKDKVLGRGAIVYVTNVSTTSASGTFKVTAKRVTIYMPGGSLTGTGSALQTFNDDGTTNVHDGVFNLTKGAGKLKGHSLKGTFSGPQEKGVYKFTYSGTYK